MTDHTEGKSFLKKMGGRIKKFREQKNYSQQELAELCGVSPGTMMKIEKGEADPWMDTLFCISNFLNIPLVEFLD